MEWRDSVIVSICEEKGDVRNCFNREIQLMFHTMMIWESVMDRTIREETIIGEKQFGFMPGRGTIDVEIVLRQILENHREK